MTSWWAADSVTPHKHAADFATLPKQELSAINFDFNTRSPLHIMEDSPKCFDQSRAQHNAKEE